MHMLMFLGFNHSLDIYIVIFLYSATKHPNQIYITGTESERYLCGVVIELVIVQSS